MGFNEGGRDAALGVLAREGLLTIVGGVGAKTAFKVGGVVYTSSKAAWKAAVAKYPSLRVVGKLTRGVENAVAKGVDTVKTAAKKAGKTAADPLKVTRHGVSRKIERELRSQDVLATIKDPKIRKEVVVDRLGRPSQRLIGPDVEVVINPESGAILSVNKTRANTRKKIEG